MHYDIRQLSTTHTILVQEDNDQGLRKTVVHICTSYSPVLVEK